MRSPSTKIFKLMLVEGGDPPLTRGDESQRVRFHHVSSLEGSFILATRADGLEVGRSC